jgi:hypothetical protein
MFYRVSDCYRQIELSPRTSNPIAFETTTLSLSLRNVVSLKVALVSNTTFYRFRFFILILCSLVYLFLGLLLVSAHFVFESNMLVDTWTTDEAHHA